MNGINPTVPPPSLALLTIQNLHLTLRSSIPHHKRAFVPGQFTQPLEITESSSPPPGNCTLPSLVMMDIFWTCTIFHEQQISESPSPSHHPPARCTCHRKQWRSLAPAGFDYTLILRKFETNIAFI